jgi:hypothetical protein
MVKQTEKYQKRTDRLAYRQYMRRLYSEIQDSQDYCSFFPFSRLSFNGEDYYCDLNANCLYNEGYNPHFPRSK